MGKVKKYHFTTFTHLKVLGDPKIGLRVTKNLKVGSQPSL